MKQYVLEWKDISGQDVYNLGIEEVVSITQMINQISIFLSDGLNSKNFVEFKKISDEEDYGLMMQYLKYFLLQALMHESPQDYVNITKTKLTIMDGNKTTHYKPS